MDLTSSVGNKLVPGDELSYDRAKEVKEFDETKAGVKGLVDSGVTKVPRFLIHPPESLPNPMLSPATTLFHVPEIDLQGFEQSCQRMEIVDQIRKASETWGFFQMINHGVPVSAMDKMFESVQQFHEQPKEEKIKWYSRDLKQPVKYYSNMDLLVSKAASWKDSISFDFKYGPLNLEALPLAFRESVSEYWKHMIELTKALKELLSEALGLSTDYLANIECMKSALFVCHYYPACPESDLTLGTKKHSDPSSITILLQDNIGGLQVLHQDHWVDVPPVHRALVVNIGDLLQVAGAAVIFEVQRSSRSEARKEELHKQELQLITNDKFRSVEHRVLAGRIGPRISAACFLHPSPGRKLGPIKEFLSDSNPPIYRETHISEYNAHYTSKGGNSALSHFKLLQTMLAINRIEVQGIANFNS
ncbi:1-aminocyclopropane-1-carboxylate oxidase homolog 1-like isoform X2 [Quercus robur]|uniref:1-aminocyclopropane-1-carboxylate oxidase homolog 1-like isoform X2 n=1 Tax=Quercus robur TaxID=38942 RepID=UPI0021617275|nr:1-aminocyclopropane-1-carboxylate oxidase homolog 1-like isoform X2 [Quercus robur]